MHPLYTPHPSLSPANVTRDVAVCTTMAMRGAELAEFAVLYRTFQMCDVRVWADWRGELCALVATHRTDNVSATLWLPELEVPTLVSGHVMVVCECWTVVPGVVYRLARDLAREPGVKWLVGRRSGKWHARRGGSGWDRPTIRAASPDVPESVPVALAT